jgi:hypothetical protein
MLRKAETLKGAHKPIRSARAQDAGSAYKPGYGWEDDQGFEEIRDETFMIIGLLCTESPTFGSE